MYRQIALIALVALCYGCEQDCFPAEGRLVLVGFSETERNTILLKSYPRNTGFQKWSDSLFINGSNCNCYVRADTFEISPFINNLPGIRSQFDYEVVLPVTGKTYRIASIREKQEKDRLGFFSKRGCLNSFESYTLNTIIVIPSANSTAIIINR